MDKEQIELLIVTVGNEVIEPLKEEVVLDKDNIDELQSFFDLAKIDETLN